MSLGLLLNAVLPRGRDHQTLSSILEALPEAALALNADRRVTHLNSQARHLLSLTSIGGIGRPAETLLMFDEEAVPPASLRRSEGVPWSATAQTRAGKSITVSSSPIVGRRGRTSGSIFVMRDMAQSIDEFDRLTTTFLSNLSHELRTPLTPMKGYARLISDDRVSTKSMRSFASAMLEASERMERVIEVLVGVAHLDAGRIDRTHVDLPVLVNEARDRYAAWFPDRVFDVSIEPEALAYEGDGRLLGLALDQMIDNAVKFSEASDVILIELRRNARGAEIVVTDRGIGISPQDQETIFSDFRQIDGSSTRTHGGLGLGLALVRRVARVHGGRVSVRSGLGKGSAFTLSLGASDPANFPARDRPQPGSWATPAPRPQPRATHRRVALRLTAAVLALIAVTASVRIMKAGLVSVKPSITVVQGEEVVIAEGSPSRRSPNGRETAIPSAREPSMLEDTEADRVEDLATVDLCSAVGEAPVEDVRHVARGAVCAIPKVSDGPAPVGQPVDDVTIA
jgi:signal transduction histidine kinase